MRSVSQRQKTMITCREAVNIMLWLAVALSSWTTSAFSQTRNVDTTALARLVAEAILSESERNRDHRAPFILDSARPGFEGNDWRALVAAAIRRSQPVALLTTGDANTLQLRISQPSFRGDTARVGISWSRCMSDGSWWGHTLHLKVTMRGDNGDVSRHSIVGVAHGTCRAVSPPGAG